MNKSIYTIIFVLLLVNITSCKTERKTAASPQNYLTRSEWGPEIGYLGLYFEFAPDNTFKTDANFEGGAGYSGTYEITTDKVKIRIVDAGEWPELKGKELSYRLKQDNTSLFFTECLELENSDPIKDSDLKKLWNQRKIVTNDQNRNYQSIAGQTINGFAEIKDDTNYYQNPSEHSKRFMFSIWDDKNDKSSEWTHIVPAEVHQLNTRRIQLVLRTMEKDNKNRFWYLVLLPVGNGRYDGIKIEGSNKNWNGSSLGWIKETDIKKIEAK